MSLEPITHTDPSPVPAAPQADMSSPAGMPDLGDKTPEEVSQLLDQMNQGGPLPKEIAPPDPAQQENQQQTPQAAPQAAPALQIPDKFKNQDGTLNAEALIKSQSDGQSYASQVKNEMEQMRAENEQLMQMAEDFQREIKASRQSSQQQGPAKMTDEQIEEYNANPQAYMDKMVDQKISAMNQKVDNQQNESHRDRMLDFKVNNALSAIKSKEGYAQLEGDINSILKTNILDYDPKGPELAYNAALGMKMPEILAQAKNGAFTEGYEKAKSELTRQVSGGGGSTLPAGGQNLDEQTLSDMSPEEMLKSGILSQHPSL